MQSRIKQNEKSRRHYIAAKAKGVCVTCGEKAERTKCDTCMKIAARYKEIRKANGLCAGCGKIKVVNFVNCLSCRKKLNKRWRTHKAAQRVRIVELETKQVAMLQTIQKAQEAIRDNLKAYHYKNEEILYEAFVECKAWTDAEI